MVYEGTMQLPTVLAQFCDKCAIVHDGTGNPSSSNPMVITVCDHIFQQRLSLVCQVLRGQSPPHRMFII